MEGHGTDDKERQAMAYEPYRPQAFDEDDAQAAPARPGLPSAAGEFRLQHEPVPGESATFEDGPRIAPSDQPDFASIKFQRENTLLTNAESYAASIREEAQLYVKQLRDEVEGLNREAEQRYQEAERAKADAQTEAERVLAEARAQTDAVRDAAHTEGFEAGREEGLQRRYAEAAPLLEQLEAVLKEISQFRKRVAFYTEKDGVRLALLIAKKVLHTELKINKQVVAKLLAGTLAKLQGKGTFRVWLNPEDYQFVAAARPALEKFLDEEQALTLRAKPDLRPGNVLIETDREMIDLTFESQFYHLEQVLNRTIDERESVLLQRRPGQAAAPAAQAATAPAQASDQADAPPVRRPAIKASARPAARPAAKPPAKAAAKPAPKPAAKPAPRPARSGGAEPPPLT
jgi:flagellar assembly protein FliH